MKISDEQAFAAYTIAKAVFNSEITKSEGSNVLNINHKLNKNSANDFISNYQHLRLGQVFKRNLKTSHLEYFLLSISRDNGLDALRIAINSLEQHIDYWEKLTNTNALSKRELVARFSVLLNAPNTIEKYQQSLNTDVESAIRMSPEERRKKLKDCENKPLTYQVISTVYVRSPIVIAERLYIAQGKCEECKRNAPFKRASNGSPYLEVHHKKPLADGGKDIIENTIALCPNCHREKHYGENIG